MNEGYIRRIIYLVLTEVDFTEVEECNVYCENKLLELMIYLTQEEMVVDLYKTDQQVRDQLDQFLELNWEFFQKKTELYVVAAQMAQNGDGKVIMDKDSFRDKIENIKFLSKLDQKYICNIKDMDFTDQNQVCKILVLNFLLNRCI
jgi:hypothetical protein